MNLKALLPLLEAKPAEERQTLSPQDQEKASGLLKLASLALGFQNNTYGLTRELNFEESPFDLERVSQAINTDSYARAAFAKYRELFWKEGWDIVGENQQAVDYLWQRIDFFEEVMQVPFQKFLGDLFDQYIRFGNVFVAKVRNDLNALFPSSLMAPPGMKPVVGYDILPTEFIHIRRDKHNKPLKYRQAIDKSILVAQTTATEPTWDAKQVIHLHYDKQPGHAFGTPFVVVALDDIVSLRQIEEDILNLVHRELFPVYAFKIGTDNIPAEPDEITQAMNEIEAMRTESAIVMPHRYDVEVIGTGDKALDASEYLSHFRERVATGLGVYPHHLGMGSGAANRAVTDRLDTMLYDRIKYFQKDFAELIRFHFFSEWLREGGFDPMVNPRLSGASDRCVFKFREIDVDTQIKKESHVLGKATANLQGIPESRLEIGREPDLDDADTMAALQARMVPQQAVTGGGAGNGAGNGSGSSAKLIDTTPAAASKQTPSSGGRPNPANIKKGAGNIVRPTNQYGTRTSPAVRNSLEWADEWVEILDEEDDEHVSED